MADPRCILVLGTPRSGTSAVAGVLHHLGLPMGERLLEADDWNPAGYFQDADFEHLVRKETGGFFPSWDEVRGARQQKPRGATEIRRLVAARMNAGRDWGLKTNRVAHWLDDLVEAAEGRVDVIRTSRPRNASIQSWQARSEQSREESAGVIDRTNDAINRGLTLCGLTPILTVDYDSLVTLPTVGVGLIATAVGLPVNRAAIDFVDVTLRRFGSE